MDQRWKITIIGYYRKGDNLTMVVQPGSLLWSFLGKKDGIALKDND